MYLLQWDEPETLTNNKTEEYYITLYQGLWARTGQDSIFSGKNLLIPIPVTDNETETEQTGMGELKSQNGRLMEGRKHPKS